MKVVFATCQRPPAASSRSPANVAVSPLLLLTVPAVTVVVPVTTTWLVSTTPVAAPNRTSRKRDCEALGFWKNTVCVPPPFSTVV
ncbi:hypothetical protein D3C83_146090 [compost metagenome]